MSIAIGAFPDMSHLPDFDDMVAHPALLVPHKIPVDEDTILPCFPILMEAIPDEFNATPLFVMAHNIPFHEIQARVAFHIWPHSIKISPDQLDPYGIPNDMFYNSQIISQKFPSEPSSKEIKASSLAMEIHFFDCLQDSTKLQTRAIYEILHHVFEDHHFDFASNLKGYTKPLYNICPENNTTEQPRPNSTSDSKENTKPSSPEVTLKQESQNSAFDSDKNAVSSSDTNSTSTTPSPKKSTQTTKS
jgi:hypothetical protein